MPEGSPYTLILLPSSSAADAASRPARADLSQDGGAPADAVEHARKLAEQRLGATKSKAKKLVRDDDDDEPADGGGGGADGAGAGDLALEAHQP